MFYDTDISLDKIIISSQKFIQCLPVVSYHSIINIEANSRNYDAYIYAYIYIFVGLIVMLCDR